MKKYFSSSFWSCLSFSALLLAAPILHGQIGQTFNPNFFDINISFGCNCTCWCETNTVDTNNPVSVFLAANPVEQIASSAVMPARGQKVPPHWTEMLSLTSPPLYGNSDGSDITILADGWTMTQSSAAQLGIYGWTPYEAVTFNLNYPIQFQLLNYWFYADALLSNLSSSPAGQAPMESQTQFQPYPWDVNLTLKLHNQQLYYMEQQLVVGYDPEYYSQAVETLVNYEETNSLLTISLYCTYGGVTNILPVSSASITATLLPVNIPAPLNQNIGWEFTPDFYTNWAWPLTIDDNTVNNTTVPDVSSWPRGAAGTVQASLDLGAGNIDHVNLLVRADRAYQLALTYNLSGTQIGPLYITNTGVLPPCTNLSFPFYTVTCTNVPEPSNQLCYATNVGMVDMMGPPDDPPGITMWAFGDNNTSHPTLTGTAALSHLPAPYVLPVLLQNEESDTSFEKWATESLGLDTTYEYFRSPSVKPVTEECSKTNDLGDDFVICTNNAATVQGTITLNGCVDTNFYSGVGALNYLQFAVYSNGLPCDPIVSPYTSFTSGDPLDLTLQNVSSIQATNGASAVSPFNTGHGQAITEFDNSGAFAAPNNYTGQYALKLGGLQSRPSVWDVNDLHLVFGDPVNLDYHVILIGTNSPYTNINISCGTKVTNNIALCFGLVTIPVINAHSQPIPLNLIYTSANIQVSGTGPGYTIGQLNFNNCTFRFQSQTHNEADIPLFLPRGSYQYTTTVVTAGGSHLVLGTNSFTVICCTNPCLLVVDCPTNKDVSCATNWTFDLPTVHTNCCGTNYSINVYTNVASSNGPCSWSSTRTWLITDCNGDTSFCSQTVTVSPSSSYSITFPAGVFELIANQLDNGSGNKISTLFSSLPNNSTVAEWNCASASLVTSTKNFGTWSTDYTLAPGQGAFVKSASTVTVTFTGTPLCPPPTNSLCPCGTESLLSYGLDCLGTYEDITGLQPQEGSTVRRWNGSGYTINTFTGGAWTLGAPVLNVGEAAYFLIPCPTNPPVPPILPVNEGGTTKAIVFTPGAGNGTFTFNNNAWSVGSYNYTLQWTTNLGSPNWRTVCNAIPTIGYSFTNAAPVSFYRLLLQTNY